jgi:methylmalonyl-CoA/ethylmalonyl-CoA epimerase
LKEELVNPIEIGRLRQVAFVVPDLDAAMDQWHRTTNAGPFYVERHGKPNVTYRGEATPLEFSVAFAGLGDVMLELIEQHNDGPSVYRDSFAPGTGGLHHFGYVVDSFDGIEEEYRSRGIELAMTLHDVDPILYFDTRAETGGAMTEVLLYGQERGDMFERAIASGRNWDGKDPRRPADQA